MIARLLISQSLETTRDEVLKILASHMTSGNTDYSLKSHPDILYFEAGSKLGIEQARQIKSHFLLKPYSAKGRVVVLEDASNLTQEAQNALLKTLEEPPEEAVLILGTKSESDLLPTVVSRCQIVILNSVKDLSRMRDPNKTSASSVESLGDSSPAPESVRDQNDRYMEDIEKLLNSTLEERFEYIGNLKEKEEFLHSLIEYFRAQLLQLLYDPLRLVGDEASRSTFVTSEDLKNFLKELLQAEEWAKQNVNIRAILEYLMLVMPNRESI